MPELDKVITNRELISLELNRNKKAEVSERQVSLAEKLHAAALLNHEGLEKVKHAGNRL